MLGAVCCSGYELDNCSDSMIYLMPKATVMKQDLRLKILEMRYFRAAANEQ